ncbi:pleiotropic regulatory protein RsmS [Vibrio sp.]|nr:pleiotropic regulatory protein RsmS [Vibrio sp.]
MNTTPLDNASDDIKLAVDLIYLLESHDIAPETALSALKIVENDLKQKLLTSTPS